MRNKILKTMISLLLVLSIVGSVSACGGDEEFTGEYYNYGLHYTLPEEYRQLTSMRSVPSLTLPRFCGCPRTPSA